MNFRDKMQWEMVDAIRESLKECGSATVVAATGCLSGDSVVTINRSGGSEKITIRDLCIKFKNYPYEKPFKGFGKVKSNKIRSFIKDEKRIGLNDFLDAVYSGVKEVYKIELENGFSLKSTECHKFLTKRGYVRLDKILDSDEVMVDEFPKPVKTKRKKKIYDIFWEVGKYHKYAKTINTKRGPRIRIEKHRLIYEANLNGMTKEEFQEATKKPNTLKYVDPKIYDIHHIDFDHYNNDIKNLIHLKKSEHRKIHQKQNTKNFSQGIVKYSKLKSIEYVGFEETYDIRCVNKDKNFVANGIIVHNSGKTETVRKIKSKLKEGSKLLFIAPKINNVTDAAQRYDAAINVGSLGLNESGQVTCTTKQSIHKIDTDDYDVAVFDEMHNYKEEFIESISAKFKIFLSATPWNDFGYIWDQYKSVPYPCFKFTLKDGIKNGVLCRYEIFGTKHAFDVSKYKKTRGDYTKTQLTEIIKQNKNKDQVSEIIAISKEYSRRKVAILCANIEHAEQTKSEFEHQGESCVVVHSKLKKSHEIIDDFKKNKVKFICSVAMMQEGTDIPEIDCIAYLRPIKSSRVMVQSVGRGLRLHKNKEYCLILDYGHVFENCGLPISAIVPEPKGKSKEKQEPSPIKQCEECFFIYEKSEHGHTCPSCGHFHKKDRDVEKNLKESLLEKEKVHEIIITRDNIYKYGKTKRGFQPFMTIKVNGEFHTLFGYQYKATISKMKASGKVLIKYKKEGKYKFKFVSVDSI